MSDILYVYEISYMYMRYPVIEKSNLEYYIVGKVILFALLTKKVNFITKEGVERKVMVYGF